MDFQNLYAERIGGKGFGKDKGVFKFEKIKIAKRQAEEIMPELSLIDLGIGESDDMADRGIIEALYENAGKWENRGYADNGIYEFQKEAVKYLTSVYGVKQLEPKREILHVMGSKSALALIPQAFINPGDVTIMTVPGYPILGTKTTWLGGTVFPIPLMGKNNYLPDLERIPAEVRQRAKLFYLNYPNNPTGAVANKKFFEEVISFAKENQILIIQDAAYGPLVYGDVKPLSFLSVPGAKEVGVEIHSLSKAFNMTGWRLGFIAGNEKVVKAVAAVKNNNDSGQFKGIQQAGIYALSHSEITTHNVEKLERRHKKLMKVFKDCGFKVQKPKATYYEYMEIPKGTKDGLLFENAEKFTEYLIYKTKISAVPWDDVGHYIRISVTFAAKTLKEEDEIIQELGRRLKACEFVF